MKSPNVLVWYFPSAECSHSDRVRHAGNVWLKLADYGISQVSTGFVMRVRNTPVGTPGYMAPELFEQLGQQVSSEKVSSLDSLTHTHTHVYLRQLIFLRKSDCLGCGVLLCLVDLACFFLPYSSLIQHV